MADSQKSHEAAASFQNEIAAYNDLHEAQGVCLPELTVSYGTAMYNMAQYIATSCISGLTLEQAGAVSDAQRHSAFLVHKIVALSREWLHEDWNMSLGHPFSHHFTQCQGLRFIHELGRLHGEIQGPNGKRHFNHHQIAPQTTPPARSKYPHLSPP
jgi:hypothetical protein